MAIFAWLVSRLSQSASTILNAIFGWAVLALFGRTSQKERTLLTGVVAAAAVWPLLVIGALFPKLAAFAFAFVPLPSWVPSWAPRLVWLGLVALVPLTLAITFAAKAPPATPPEPTWRRLARGFPITLGVASSFWLMLFIAPALRLVSILKGWQDEHVTLLPRPGHYLEVSKAIGGALVEHGLDIAHAPSPWWLSAPAGALHALGGKAMRSYAPRETVYYRGASLQLVFYPSDVMVRGKPPDTARAHAVMTEALGPLLANQVVTPAAKALEDELKGVWQAFATAPEAHAGSAVLRRRLLEIAEKLARAQIPFAEWEVVYRQTLQLSHALTGAPPLLTRTLQTRTKERTMKRESASPERPFPAPEQLSTRELFSELAAEARLLAQKELQLAKVELRETISKEIGMAEGLGIAGLFSIVTVALLFVAGAFALAMVMPGWTGALIMAGLALTVATVAGLVGWGKRATNPMARTRRTLTEDVQWAKNRIA
ncbi:MAG: phage holin family protein [Deltaproteobacteria bacterium]